MAGAAGLRRSKTVVIQLSDKIAALFKKLYEFYVF